MALNTAESVVDYLKSLGRDSSFGARNQLFKQIISSTEEYKGTADQNVRLLSALRRENLPKIQRPLKTDESIVDLLKSLDIASDFVTRSVFYKHHINDTEKYTGSSSQNSQLLKKMLWQQYEREKQNEQHLRDLQKSLSQRAELEAEKKKTAQLTELKASLEEQFSTLQNQLAELTQKFKNESEARANEKEANSNQSRLELKGLEVLRKNLDEHVGDLNRWMRYLDFDTQTELDFGETRQQIFTDIEKKDFDKQIEVMAQRLSRENDEIVQFLKAKEVEAKAKKANEKKKKKKAEV